MYSCQYIWFILKIQYNTIQHRHKQMVQHLLRSMSKQSVSSSINVESRKVKIFFIQHFPKQELLFHNKSMKCHAISIVTNTKTTKKKK